MEKRDITLLGGLITLTLASGCATIGSQKASRWHTKRHYRPSRLIMHRQVAQARNKHVFHNYSPRSVIHSHSPKRGIVYSPKQAFPRAERKMWKNNAYVPSTIFNNSGKLQRHILEETRGADFYNPRDREHAHYRAFQIKERAWNKQVKQWNRQLERQGYKRHRPRR